MRIAQFVLLAAAFSAIWIGWAYFPKEDRAEILKFLKKNWWIPVIVFAVIFYLAVVNSYLTLKLF
jgi:hypothetical protein